MEAIKECFADTNGQVSWRGVIFDNADEFNSFLANQVKERLLDLQEKQEFESELNALASTGMGTETIKKILCSDERVKTSWEIGEAIAECILEQERDVTWPWNMERDKRTPKASLPGADLIGFITKPDNIYLLLGEVKTSAQPKTPPNVMNGRSGMVHQIDLLANELCIHRCVLFWLYIRCKATMLWPMYKEAVKNYLESGGKAIVLMGLLMRDTEPHPLDLRGRAESLSKILSAPTVLELNAWYSPVPIESWPLVLVGG